MQAVIWWRKAADQGDMDAQYELGVLYQKGEGVPKDLVLAYMWENLAAAQGEEEARKLRNALERSMTLEQVGEAQKFSRNWKPATSGSAPLVARTQSSEGQGDRP
jgi:TPR repeat protein